MRTTRLIPITLVASVFLWTRVAYAQNATIQGIIQKISRQVLQPVVGLLFIIATIIFFWGVIQYVIGSQGDTKKLEQGKQVMIWGIIGMFIMAAAWGIVQVLCNFFDGCPGVFPGGPRGSSPITL